MREADRRTIEDIGIPSLVLMENAGRQVVAAIEAVHSDLVERKVAVICGRGNNGGDGFVVARTLLQRGIDVSVFVIGRVAEVRGDARTNLEILGRLGLTVVEIADSQAWELHFSEISDCTLIIDAIFGTGLNAPPVGPDGNGGGRRQWRRHPGRRHRPAVRLSADTHEPIGDSIEAGLTVTPGGAETVLRAAARRNLGAGDIVIADIGIPGDVIASLDGPQVHLMTRGAMRELVGPRMPDSHKGDYGRVLIVAARAEDGRRAPRRARRAQVGRRPVTIATPACCRRSSRR
jgi:NAD(P)H-hydrate epimerase